MDFKDYFVTFLLIGLFAVCIIGFAVNLGNENQARTNLNQNPIINKMVGNISNELNQSMTGTEAARSAIIEETGQQTILTSLGFYLKSIFYAVRVFFDIGINMVSYIFIFTQEIFGVPAIVTGTLMAIVMGVILLAAWSVWRAGR